MIYSFHRVLGGISESILIKLLQQHLVQSESPSVLAAAVTGRDPKTPGALLWRRWGFISLCFFLVMSDMGFALYRRFFVPANGSPVSSAYFFNKNLLTYHINS